MTLEELRKTVPACCSDALDASSVDELVHLVRCELDLIQEGQDGTGTRTTRLRNARTIRNWLWKYASGEVVHRCPECRNHRIVSQTPVVAGPLGWAWRCKNCGHEWSEKNAEDND